LVSLKNRDQLPFSLVELLWQWFKPQREVECTTTYRIDPCCKIPNRKRVGANVRLTTPEPCFPQNSTTLHPPPSTISHQSLLLLACVLALEYGSLNLNRPSCFSTAVDLVPVGSKSTKSGQKTKEHINFSLYTNTYTYSMAHACMYFVYRTKMVCGNMLYNSAPT
jgi:hypothetical protein